MTDELPAPYNDITALHERVRQAVEAHLGERYRVTCIEQSSITRYAQTLASQGEILPKYIAYILGECTVSFRVEAVRIPVSNITGVTERAFTQVQVASDGQLHVGSVETWSGW